MQNQFEQDIEALQTKVAHQEDTIETLSNALAEQQQQLDKLTFKMNHVVNKLKDLQPSNLASEEDETPPPHY
ncbi:SlyX family protein [Lacimicrobium alkaliphilum]|uniref:Protein SlyX homolog n=1 Tax=Lacimicrobium alkaliphilum TaxID=1526571 RepID=A0ABQ1RPQ7_9ALTE|nr:SlyX family protein [Lacimicrobium alkaliphilum]GGD77070.1 protein SlyX [Lacimicrobium alkaliphilum]